MQTKRKKASQLVEPVEEKSRNGKYEAILRAAARVFARSGYFNAKVSDVARTAGVADGTVYLYFKNKDDLLTSIFGWAMGEFINRARSVVAEFLFGALDEMATNWVLSRNNHSLTAMVEPVLDIFLNGVGNV